MDLIRVITLQTLQYNFAFTATHIPGLDNSIADSLSHFRWTTPVPWLPQPPPSLHQRWTPEFLYSDIFMLTLPLPLDAPIKLASSTSSPLTSRMVFVMYHAMLWMALRGFKMQWILFAMANSTSVHLTSNDITLVPNSHSSSNMQVHIKQSKPDPFRQGYTTTIAKSSSPICSVVAMKDYLLQAQPPSSHPLFLFVQPRHWLTQNNLTTELRTILQHCGIPVTNFYSPSFRTGAATTAAKAALPPGPIKVFGYWSSDCYECL